MIPRAIVFYETEEFTYSSESHEPRPTTVQSSAVVQVRHPRNKEMQVPQRKRATSAPIATHLNCGISHASLMWHFTVPAQRTWFQAVVRRQHGHYSLNSEAVWSTETWYLVLESSVIVTVWRGSWWGELLPGAEPAEAQDKGDGNEIQNQLCKLHHGQDRGSKPETPLVPKLGQQSHYLQDTEKGQ